MSLEWRCTGAGFTYRRSETLGITSPKICWGSVPTAPRGKEQLHSTTHVSNSFVNVIRTTHLRFFRCKSRTSWLPETTSNSFPNPALRFQGDARYQRFRKGNSTSTANDLLRKSSAATGSFEFLASKNCS
jgi:hypothetical protein